MQTPHGTHLSPIVSRISRFLVPVVGEIPEELQTIWLWRGGSCWGGYDEHSSSSDRNLCINPAYFRWGGASGRDSPSALRRRHGWPLSGRPLIMLWPSSEYARAHHGAPRRMQVFTTARLLACKCSPRRASLHASAHHGAHPCMQVLTTAPSTPPMQIEGWLQTEPTEEEMADGSALQVCH